MSDDIQKEPKSRPHIWPGMPTRRSQLFESAVVFFPAWLALIGIAISLLLPLFHPCRDMAIKNAEQAPPLNGPDIRHELQH
jgi:hypothetical protein